MNNTLYPRLSGIKLLSKSYSNKFLFIAFLGIHIPLIGIIFFVIFNEGNISTLTILILTLLLTLGASAITLFILNGLLNPLIQSKKALEQYLHERKLPDLPTIYNDEAGILMQKVQETITKLDGLLEEKKNLIALLSHDVRTPLANIKLLASVIGNDDTSHADLKEVSKLISQSVDEQMTLFQDILEILRQDDLEMMKLNLNETPTANIIELALHDVSKLAEKKGILLEINNNYDGTLKVESGIFPQVIKNLLSNSIKFSHPGSTINLNINKPNGKVKIEVTDNGTGFNPEDAELLFDKFTSKGKKGTLNEPSTGMGLFLSRKIVEAHKGKLYAQSEGLNKGSKFIIEL
jgi:signal transduction histidine kinase